MAERSDSSLAALLLSQRLVDVPDAAPFTATEHWRLIARLGDPATLLGADVGTIEQIARTDPQTSARIVHRLDAATAVALELDSLEHSGVRVLSALDDDFPQPLVERLGDAAPPLLYVAGDPGVLHEALLGIVGSRDVSEPGAHAAREVAAAAVGRGLGIVSGGARGVDRLAMYAALEAHGHALGVLADSLIRTLRDPDTRRAITDGTLCLCTPFTPTAGFSVANAMGRNKIVYALARAVFVVAADLEGGGTWAGPIEALQRDLAPVLVWCGDGRGPGNAELIAAGAHPLAEVDELFPLPTAWERPTEPAGQLGLGL